MKKFTKIVRQIQLEVSPVTGLKIKESFHSHQNLDYLVKPWKNILSTSTKSFQFLQK